MSPEQAEFIQSLADNEGRITPEAVIEAARPPDSLINGLFTWDNTKAAEKWRLHQARSAIVRVTFEVTVRHRILAVPVYVRDPEKAKKEAGYREVAEIATHEDLAQRALERELRAIEALVTRARAVAAGLGMTAAYEGALRAIIVPPAVVVEDPALV